MKKSGLMLLLITLAMQCVFSQTFKPVSCDELLKTDLIVLLNNNTVEAMNYYFLNERGYNSVNEDAFDIPDDDEYLEPYLFSGSGYFHSFLQYSFYTTPENYDTWNGNVFIRWIEPHDKQYKQVFEISIESKEKNAVKSWQKFAKAQNWECVSKTGYMECKPTKASLPIEVGSGSFKTTITLSFIHIRSEENRNPAFKVLYTME